MVTRAGPGRSWKPRMCVCQGPNYLSHCLLPPAQAGSGVEPVLEPKHSDVGVGILTARPRPALCSLQLSEGTKCARAANRSVLLEALTEEVSTDGEAQGRSPESWGDEQPEATALGGE